MKMIQGPCAHMGLHEIYTLTDLTVIEFILRHQTQHSRPYCYGIDFVWAKLTLNLTEIWYLSKSKCLHQNYADGQSGATT
jgi:hypothetical protein